MYLGEMIESFILKRWVLKYEIKIIWNLDVEIINFDWNLDILIMCYRLLFFIRWLGVRSYYFCVKEFLFNIRWL